MNEFLATFVMCFAFLYFLEGIDVTLTKRKNRIYNITHILYPLYMVIVMLYFLKTGVLGN